MAGKVTVSTAGEKRSDPLASGVWAVVPTPFTGPARSIDPAGIERLATFYSEVGVTGLTVLGVFGEAASLTADEKSSVLRHIARSFAGPIVVGIAARATRPVIDEVQRAADVLGDRLRAAMIQVNSARPGDVVQHLREVHAHAAVPVVLQDYPKASGVAIASEDLAQVVAHCPSVCAVKVESPPTSIAIARLSRRVSVPLFGGLGGQGLLDELAAGSAGAMTGFSYPEGLVTGVRAWLAGDADAARAALLPCLPLINFEQQPGVALAIRKELYRRRGLFADAAVRRPATPFPAELAGIAQAHLDRLSVRTAAH